MSRITRSFHFHYFNSICLRSVEYFRTLSTYQKSKSMPSVSLKHVAARFDGFSGFTVWIYRNAKWIERKQRPFDAKYDFVHVEFNRGFRFASFNRRYRKRYPWYDRAEGSQRRVIHEWEGSGKYCESTRERQSSSRLPDGSDKGEHFQGSGLESIGPIQQIWTLSKGQGDLPLISFARGAISSVNTKSRNLLQIKRNQSRAAVFIRRVKKQPLTTDIFFPASENLVGRAEFHRSSVCWEFHDFVVKELIQWTDFSKIEMQKSRKLYAGLSLEWKIRFTLFLFVPC